MHRPILLPVVVAFLALAPTSAAAQTVAHHPALSIQETATGVSGIRMAHDPISGQLIVAAMNGDLHAAHPYTENLAVARVYMLALRAPDRAPVMKQVVILDRP